MGDLVDALPQLDGFEDEREIFEAAFGEDNDQAASPQVYDAFQANLQRLHAWLLSMREAGQVPDEIMDAWNASFVVRSADSDDADPDDLACEGSA